MYFSSSLLLISWCQNFTHKVASMGDKNVFKVYTFNTYERKLHKNYMLNSCSFCFSFFLFSFSLVSLFSYFSSRLPSLPLLDCFLVNRTHPHCFIFSFIYQFLVPMCYTNWQVSVSFPMYHTVSHHTICESVLMVSL